MELPGATCPPALTVTLPTLPVPPRVPPLLTMTLPVLSAAAQVVYLVLGEAKAAAVQLAFARPPDPAVPASLLRSEHGETIVLLDRPAAARLDNST